MARKQPNVGLLGLGIIGSRAAANLRAAGFPVFVWNRSPKAAPNFLGSPAEVARNCKIIQLFVADALAVFDVIEAMADALTPEHLIIGSATIGPVATHQAAKLVEKSGATFLDAPFTGSKMAAENRQLVYYIGGDEHAFLRAKPVLEATSKAIVQVGKIGDAAVLKVATNLISAVSAQVLSEALAIVRKSGLDAESLAAALEHNACRSGVIDIKLPKMAHCDYSPHFSLKHMYKDVQFGLNMARDLGIDVPICSTTSRVYSGALDQGWGDLDFASVFKLYEPLLPPLDPPPTSPENTPDSEPLEIVSAIPESAQLAKDNQDNPALPADPLPESDTPPGFSQKLKRLFRSKSK